jgi:hypothetical protein
MGQNMLLATNPTPECIRFGVTITSTAGRRHYITTATSSIAAWEKAADYSGDAACAITVVPARSVA